LGLLKGLSHETIHHIGIVAKEFSGREGGEGFLGHPVLDIF
jgi:hypothetical protein